MNNQSDKDQQINHYLSGNSELSAIYAKAAKEKAPDKLSVRIKAMARQDLNQSRHLSRWYIPLSIAAAILLSLTVYFVGKKPADDKVVPDLAEKQNLIKKNNKNEIATHDLKRTEQPALPGYISDLLQQTGKRSDAQIEPYPDKTELKTWQADKWARKISQLRKQGNNALADRFKNDFRNYYPDKDIEKLISGLD